MTVAIPLRVSVEECEPHGQCGTCGDPIFLKAYEISVEIMGEREPVMTVCASCWDAHAAHGG